ncbi:MAG: hypothetical protein WC378_04500 [Opitutaceae bacterium]|jgi:hypothetical protein
MIFARPMPFKEALKASQVRILMPTSFGTADLAKLDASVLERARFSARVRSAEHLAVIDDGINDLASGQIDLATARLRVKQYLRSTGYKAEEGTAGGLQDFSSDTRIDLQLLTNVQQAQGYGWWKQGQDPDLLDAFPAQEFLRVESRIKPRQDWPQRWDAARAATTTDGATESGSGRMVALKNHPIWVALSRFGTPYEPFDFNSGMGVEDVARADAMDLGIIERDTQIFPEDRPFNADLKASPEIRSERLRALLEQSGVGHFDDQGVFVVGAKGGRD